MNSLTFDKEQLKNNAEELNISGMYMVYVYSCYDGDTFTGSLHHKGLYLKFKMRLYGCDAFEYKAINTHNGKKIKNTEELKELGMKARNRLTELINNKYITINALGMDLYGRVLADITHIEDEEINVKDIMINENLAFAYYGKGEKQQTKYYVYE